VQEIEDGGVGVVVHGEEVGAHDEGGDQVVEVEVEVEHEEEDRIVVVVVEDEGDGVVEDEGGEIEDEEETDPIGPGVEEASMTKPSMPRGIIDPILRSVREA